MIELSVGFDALPRLDAIGRRLRVATERQTFRATQLLEYKVLENLTGKILQLKTGQLYDSVRKTLDQNGDVYEGRVFIEPVTDKALALEYGGEGYYPIDPSKGEFLKFYWEKMGSVVLARHVNHPPSKEFMYLRAAMDEAREEIPQGYQNVIMDVVNGGDGN
jgi:hypothetical protein